MLILHWTNAYLYSFAIKMFNIIKCANNNVHQYLYRRTVALSICLLLISKLLFLI